jgi:hypothetical protein
MHLPDIVEYLEEQDTASIESTDFQYPELCQVVINSLRILALNERELYEDILRDGLGDATIACITEDTPQIREELGIIQNLQVLYQELRLMKLEGKVYDVLDEFFNANLDKTL